MRLIGITGRAGSGKTSMAEIFESRGYVKKSFADPIKWIAKRYYFWDGKKDDRGRRLLQVLGTEAGREYDPNVWIKHIEQYLEARIKMVDYETNKKKPRKVDEILVVIDDVRFPNEAKLIKDMGGKVIKLTGKSYDMGTLSKHASEQELEGDYPINIPDMGDKASFLQQAEIELKKLGLID